MQLEIDEIKEVKDTASLPDDSGDGGADDALRHIAARSCMLDGLYQYDVKPIFQVSKETLLIFILAYRMLVMVDFSFLSRS